MPEIQVIARYSVYPDREHELLGMLKSFAETTRTEPGNLSFEAYRSLEHTEDIILLERYSSQEALDMHRDSDHVKHLLLGSIVPLLKRRVVEFYEVRG